MYQTRNAVIGNLPTALRSLVLSVVLILSAFLPSFPSKAAPVIVRQDSIQYVLNMATHTAKVDGYMVGIANAVIPDTITYENNRFPVTRIGNYVFRGCGTLRSISLPETLDTIGEESFKQCSGLTSIAIPNSVKIIGPHAFYQSENLSSVTLGDSLKQICYGAFYYCKALKHIDIPNSVTHLGSYAFKLSGLESIKLSESLTCLNNQLFQGTPIKQLVIPASINSIGLYVFLGCKELRSIEVSENNQKYYAQDGVLYTKDGQLDLYPQAKEGINFKIPENIINIGFESFYQNRFLKTVQFPQTLQTISERAFMHSKSLVSLDIPSSLREIGDDAFRGCYELTKINIAADNPNFTVKDGILYNKRMSILYLCPSAKNIQDFYVPEGVITISPGAFHYQNNLQTVILPSTVTTVGDNAFNGCKKLKSISLSENLKKIGKNAFSADSMLTSILIPNSVTEIEINAFSSCKALKK